MREVERVEFGLENTEVLVIDGKYIGNFSVSDIKRKIIKHYSSILDMNVCETFSIAIHRDANKDYQVLDIPGEEYKENVFERLSNGDICSFNLFYSDQSQEEFYLDWTGDSDYKNESQHSYISELGDLFVVVSKDQKVEDFFGSWNVDEEDGFIRLMWGK